MQITPESARSGSDTFAVERLPGYVPYREALARQIERRDQVARGERPETVFVLEHAPVFTLGRNAHEHHLLRSRAQLQAMGIDVVEVDRGGDVTYHGPGQLVVYPIIDLARRAPSVNWYLRALEQSVIDALGGFGVHGERLDGYTGVWTSGGKIAAIGVGIHRWISYHGLAINVNPNMEHWSLIVPCGIPNKPVTSLHEILGEAPPICEVADTLVTSLARNLSAGPRPAASPRTSRREVY